MNIKTLITALVLAGSSSVAMAQPSFHVGGSVKMTANAQANAQIDIRDHRTHQPPRIIVQPVSDIRSDVRSDVRSDLQRFQFTSYSPERPTYGVEPCEPVAGGWSFVTPSRSDFRDRALMFDVNAWTGAIKLNGGMKTGTYDVRILYADGHSANISVNTGSYQTNIAPGVVSKIALTMSSPGIAPTLFVSSANH